MDILREMVFALPPLRDGSVVCDLGSGSGRCAVAIAEAYPEACFVLVDMDVERGERAMKRVRAAGVDAVQFQQMTISPDSLRDYDSFDCVTAMQSVRHVVAAPAHYAEKGAVSNANIHEGYREMFKAVLQTLKPGGHFFLGDHTTHGHPGVFEHLELLKEAGFIDIDVAWREKDWFVVGARKPA